MLQHPIVKAHNTYTVSNSIMCDYREKNIFSELQDRVFHIGHPDQSAWLSRFLRFRPFQATVQLRETVSYRGNTIFLALRGREKPLMFRKVFVFRVYNRVSKFVTFVGSSKGTFSGYGELHDTHDIA